MEEKEEEKKAKRQSRCASGRLHCASLNKCPANARIFAVQLCPGYVRAESKPWAKKRAITAFLYIRITLAVGSFIAPLSVDRQKLPLASENL
jgi:hypothetical protein